MQTFTFTGCSFTVGQGLPGEKKDPNNYANLVAEHYNAEANNLAVCGNSNYNIFILAVNELLFNTPDVLFVQWSALNRHRLYPGPTMKLPIAGQLISVLEGIDQFFTQDQLQKFSNHFRLLNHDYHNLLSVINYSKILQALSKNKCQLVIINGLLPWTKELTYIQSISDPAKYFSAYTKSLLTTELLPDDDIVKYFTQLLKSIEDLDKTLWVNMFSSMQARIVDFGTDNQHPGPNSHKLYANQIINYLKEQQ
jgi:hypothetical protein